MNMNLACVSSVQLLSIGISSLFCLKMTVSLFLYIACLILKEDTAFTLRIVQNDLKHYLQLPLSSYNLTFVSKSFTHGRNMICGLIETTLYMYHIYYICILLH